MADSAVLNSACENSSLNPKDSPIAQQSVGKHDNKVTNGSTNKHQIDPTEQLVEKMESSPNDKTRPRSITKPKVLIRSHAIREAASPPLSDEHDENQAEESIGSATTCGNNDPTLNDLYTKQQAESLTGNSPSISSDSDTGIATQSSSKNEFGNEKCLPTVTYTDNTGVNLQDFIVETLHRNYKDRTTLLKIEQEMVELIKSERTHHKFSSMSSYHRMLVHRVAAFFGLEHNVDQTGNCVVVSKSSRTRLPSNAIGFKTWIQENIILPEEPNKKMNLKREVLSLDEFNDRELQRRLAQNRSQSCEGDHIITAGISINNRHQFLQRQIPVVGSTINSLQNKHPTASSSVASSGARPKQFESAQCIASSKYTRKNQDLQPYNFNGNSWHFLPNSNRIPKVESFDSRELYHGYDDGFRPLLVRPMKSYSFGGYVAPNCENIGNGYDRHKHNEIYNSEIVDAALNENSSSSNISRLSPISSGYKSQYSHSSSSISSSFPLSRNLLLSPHYSSSSFNSSSLDEFPEPQDSYVTPLSSTYESFSPVVTESTEIDQSVVPEIVSLSIEDSPLSIPTVMAVAPLDAVPPGGILLNPQTGQPFYNYEANQFSRCDSRQPQSTFYESYNNYSLPALLPFSSYNSDYLIPSFSTGNEFPNPQTYGYYVSPPVENRTMVQKSMQMPTASPSQGYFLYQSNLMPHSSISDNNSCLPIPTSAAIIKDSNHHQPVFQIFESQELAEARGSYVAPNTMFTPAEQLPCHLPRSVAPRNSTYHTADLRVTRTPLHRQQSLPVSPASPFAQTPRLQRQKTLVSASHLGQQHPNITHAQNQRIMPPRPPVLNVAFPKST